MHRDNQSSILAITNSAGAVIEKRLFDPWGNIVAVQDGAGNNLGKLTFFDRGYTGHEHLQGVGLINMNARLYDPRLHADLIHGSSAGNWLRGGVASSSKVLLRSGQVVGGAGILLEGRDWVNGEMSGTEFTVDTAISVAGMCAEGIAIGIGCTAAAPWIAGGAILYFGGKAVYEYSTGTTLFTKPK